MKEVTVKKTLYILIIAIISIIVFTGLYLHNNSTTENPSVGTTENFDVNTIELKVVNIATDSYGKFIDFENGTGYYIGTVDEYLWKSLENIVVGDTIVFNTMGTESVEDDIIIAII